MQTFDQSLFDLYTRQLITLDEALSRSSNPDEFKLRIQGIRSASDSAAKRWSAKWPTSSASPANSAALHLAHPMPFPQSQVEWVLANRARILRYACVPQFLAGVALFAFAHFTGRTDLHLLVRGARTQGKIVGFQRRQLHTHRSPSSTGMFGRNVYLPIVEFEAQGTVVRFEDSKLVSQGESVGWLSPSSTIPARSPWP